jgi:hypothetical protein
MGRENSRTRRRTSESPPAFGTVSVAALDPTPSRYVAGREKQPSIPLALRQIPIEYQVVLDAWAAELAHGVRNLNPPAR